MANRTKIGELKRRIQIIDEVSTTSATGSPTTTEDVFKSCWAKQIEMSGSEEEEGKVRSLFTTAFIVKYDAALIKGKANAMFVLDEDGYKYNIVNVVEKAYKQYLQINTIRRE